MKTPISILLVSASLAWLPSLSGHADTPPSPKPPGTQGMLVDLDHGSGTVSFDAVGRPSSLKIHGKGDAARGQIRISADGKASGSCVFKLDTLDTGIGMRNDHMKKHYLETEKFPEARLTISELALPPNYAAPDFSAENVAFKGILALHGVEKPVEGTVKLGRSGDSFKFDAKFPLKTDDFAIKTPSFAGITMASEVSVEVEASAPCSITQ